MEKKHYPIAVIGGGTAGYVAAIRAASRGAKVALIEAKEMGGTCLNRGCIPTKALIANSEMLRLFRKAKDFGIETGKVSFDYGQMLSRKDQLVGDIRKNLEQLIKSNKIDTFYGFGKFLSPNEISIQGKDEAILTFDKAIIATGSEPKNLPGMEFDGEKVHDSTTLLNHPKLPKKILILGGGVIGCEFATLYHELGVETTIVELLPSILPLEGKHIRDALTASFKKRGIKIETGTMITRMEKSGKGVTFFSQDGKSFEGDICLIAVGRDYNSKGLGLEKCGVIVEKNGSISTNEKQQTNIHHIYAVGDITGKWLLAHYSSHQGIIAADNATGHTALMDDRAVPSVIFTHPEIASVGYTLEKAVEEGYDAGIGKFPFQFLGKSRAVMETEGFAQIIIDKKTGAILGGQVVGHDAANLISEISLCIANELTIDCLTETIHPHPTLSEAWHEAGLQASGLPLHIPPSK